MKTVTVYEIGQTQRVLEADSINEILMHEWQSDGGRAWGNPGGGDRFIRYSLPVTEIVESRVEDGFTHRTRSYVAIAPRLLELLGPAVSKGMSDLAAERTREVEDLLREKRINLAALQRVRDEAADLLGLNARKATTIVELQDRLRNFREANVLIRIWRAITRAI